MQIGHTGAVAAASSGEPTRSSSTVKSRYAGLPIIPHDPSSSSIRGARLALFFTVLAWGTYASTQLFSLVFEDSSTGFASERILYLVLVTFLAMSSGAYLLARIGYFQRIHDHRRVPRSELDDYFAEHNPGMTVLVPSYREDPNVIRKTLLSAALQEFGNLRVVLLIDDPANSSDPDHRRMLDAARGLPLSIQLDLEVPHRRFSEALDAFEQEATTEAFAGSEALIALAEQYDAAAAWFDAEKNSLVRYDHTDEFVVLEFFERMRNDLGTTADAIRQAAAEPENAISRHRVHQMYARLVRIFTAELSSFERKQYGSLSHDANKAMNLNSYLGLMGGSYNVIVSDGRRVLVPAEGRAPDITVPRTEYVLTLDADSILLPEYCLRLAYYMEQPENADVAVAQTPYSSFRGTRSMIERIASATTDIQHIVHQGMTAHNATSWVGANAVIRRRALDDLLVTEEKDGFVIHKYIDDRTVIEDTESSIHLRGRGWRLYNYPERLSYSATPVDFGSLVIQRRRWSNGGLVILPAMIRQMLDPNPKAQPWTRGEFLLRLNYLASISWASIGLLVMLFYPFDSELLSPVAIIAAFPYFLCMAFDLKLTGYSRWHVFAVYGFNLLLLPVNLVGTIESLIQGIGGHKIAFARTPKIHSHTVAPLIFLLPPLLLIAWSARTLLVDIEHDRWVHGAFAALNLFATIFGVVVLIGLRTMIIDIGVSVARFLFPAEKPQPSTAPAPGWASVLYVGSSVPELIDRSTPLGMALVAKERFDMEHEPRLKQQVSDVYGREDAPAPSTSSALGEL